MPMILEHIDKIARDKQRDVLYVEFFEDLGLRYKYKNCPVRKAFMKWMDEHDIKYKECGHIAIENVWARYYTGLLYIDIAMDENNSKYLQLNEHLENKDGSFKIEGINYYYLPLKVAMQNAHHDEPGFWEKLEEEVECPL